VDIVVLNAGVDLNQSLVKMLKKKIFAFQLEMQLLVYWCWCSALLTKH
jgi:hypothetical protein